MSDVKEQFADASKAYAIASILLAEAIAKLPQDEHGQELARILKLQQRADLMRTQIARSALAKLLLNVQGGILDLEVMRQLVAMKQEQSRQLN